MINNRSSPVLNEIVLSGWQAGNDERQL